MCTNVYQAVTVFRAVLEVIDLHAEVDIQFIVFSYRIYKKHMFTCTLYEQNVNGYPFSVSVTRSTRST